MGQKEGWGRRAGEARAGDDVEIMYGAEQRHSWGTATSVDRAIMPYHLSSIGGEEPRPKTDEEATRRNAAMVGHISRELDPAVFAASGSAQLLEWYSRSLGLTDYPDLSDRAFG